MSDALSFLDVATLRGLYAEGQVSPVEATQAALERIRDHDQAVNAFVMVDEQGALQGARASQARWNEGVPYGPFDGIPVSIKDLLFWTGHPTYRGSRLLENEPASQMDSPATARLRESGAVILGKTTTPEFGWKGVTDSPLSGITRNPWDVDRTAGGSSGGSAAAVALGMGVVSVGTDGGGSVRIPASFTGTVALKPTYGRVPTFPATAFGNLSHVGPMGRTVADVAALLDVIGQPDPRDWSSLGAAGVSFTEALSRPVEGVRVAYSPDLGFARVDPDVARVVQEAVEALRSSGAEVTEVEPFFDDPREAFLVFWASGAAGALASRGEDELAVVDPGLLAMAETGRSLSALDHVAATATRAKLGRILGEFHLSYDILLTPTMPLLPFEAGADVPSGSGLTNWFEWSPFTYAFNLTQQPAASIPCGTVAGLPVGLHIVGPRFADADVLNFAQHCEQVLGTYPLPPLAGNGQAAY